MEKQLFYDKTEGMLWCEDENGEAKFCSWIDDATDEEVQNAIDKVAPKDE